MAENTERLEDQNQQEEKSDGRESYEWVQALVCSVLAVVVLFTFVARLIGVDGHSMLPTLQNGDRMLVLNSILYHDYKYGDVVVLRKDTFLKEPIVKRVIATEGETVDGEARRWTSTLTAAPSTWRASPCGRTISTS